MKRIKKDSNVLDDILSQDTLCPPSIVRHLKGGHIYTYSSYWDFDLKETKIFKRRKVLRLIRKFNKNYHYIIVNGVKFKTKIK